MRSIRKRSRETGCHVYKVGVLGGKLGFEVTGKLRGYSLPLTRTRVDKKCV